MNTFSRYVFDAMSHIYNAIYSVNFECVFKIVARIPPVKSPQGQNGDRAVVPNGVLLPAPIPVSGGQQDIRQRPKIPLPRDDEDDPYTLVGGSKNGRGDNVPPKLPPRDLNIPKVSPYMRKFLYLFVIFHTIKHQDLMIQLQQGLLFMCRS